MSFGLNSSKNAIGMAGLMMGGEAPGVKGRVDTSKIEEELIHSSSLDAFIPDDIDKEIDELRAGLDKNFENIMSDDAEYVPVPPHQSSTQSPPITQTLWPPTSFVNRAPAATSELTDEQLRHQHMQAVLNMRKEQDLPDFNGGGAGHAYSGTHSGAHSSGGGGGGVVDDDAKSVSSSIDYEAYSRFRNEDDEKVRLYNQIIALQESLKHFYVGSTNIKFDVSRGSTLRELRDVFSILVQINNQVKNHQMFEAMAMGGAKVLENIFNGKREILGTRLNLKGWSNTLSVKLRHLQYETSEFVRQSTSSSQITPGSRIAMELLSSLVLYSIYPKRESTEMEKPEEELEAEYANAMRDLQNVQP